MREVLYEETAEPVNKKAQKIIYVIYSILFWTTLLVGIFFAAYLLFIVLDVGILIFTLLLFGSSFLLWFIRTKIYYCVDYIFVTGSVRIVKVINYKRRKKLVIFDSNEVITVGRAGSETFDKIYRTPGVKKIFATPNRNFDEGYYVFIEQGGIKYLVVLECKETFLQHLVAFTGRTVVEKEYK